MKLLMAGLLCASFALGAGRIVYSKSFPGSTPAFVGITFEQDGKAVYQESVDDEFPIRFALSKEETGTIFQLAGKVDHFKRPLESGLPVAKMGEKMFRWEDGDENHEVKFNYSQDADARSLHEWFEKMTETAQHYIALERSVKFDKLGVNKALLHFHVAYDRGRLVGLAVFLPLLDRVVKNDTYLNMARDRAAQLAQQIRNPPKPAEAGKAESQ
ncbi:MAG: hypothetical protein FJW31_15860 [Acidobacteria bacterium]|nr:hypothetical protein [Acidobacteriota bacterium]